MNDDRLDTSARPQFAAELEAELLRVIGARPANDQHRNDRDRDNDNDPSKENIVTLDPGTTPSSPTASPNRRVIWSIVGIAAAIVVLAVGIVVANRHTSDASPATTSPAGGHAVTFQVMWTSDQTKDCVANDKNETVCLMHFKVPATATFTGDIAGTAYQEGVWTDGAPYPNSAQNHVEQVNVYRVLGTVAGCGAGDFLVLENLQFLTAKDGNIDHGTFVGSWRIVDQSGRDGLSTITGSGTTTSPISTLQKHEPRTFTGSISCPAAPSTAPTTT